MSLRTRLVSAADRENAHKVATKAAASKSLLTRRPALGEVGNQLAIQETKRAVIAKKPLQAVQPPLKKTVQDSKKPVIVKLQKPTKAVEEVPKHDLEDEPLSKQVEPISQQRTTENAPSYSTSQLLTVLDVDANDKDPFLVAEYIQDIFKYLRSKESEFKVDESFLAGHQSTPRMRSILVNWLVDVHSNFGLLPETLHLSIGILDLYLQKNNTLGREVLQLVGITSLFVAGKYEEMYMPKLDSFVYMCDNAFTYSQILKMELDILSELKFNLGRPLALHFLRRYNKIARAEENQHNLAKYLIELCLLIYELCHIDPSLQAAAACCLAISVMNDVSNPCKVWSKELIYYSTYKYSDLKPVMIKLAYVLTTIEKSKYQAIRRKYSSSKHKKISLHPKLRGPLVKKLALEPQLVKKS